MAKIINVGIFWAIPDAVFGQSVLECKKSYYTSEANSLGFINYPYSHFETWDELRGKWTSDCYYYPRGRVIYDAKSGKHRIFADECVLQSTIDEIVESFGIEAYELCRDEHYVCAFCSFRKHSKRATRRERP